jgi:hypothetical protein
LFGNLFQLFEVDEVGNFLADELFIFVERNLNVLEDNVEQVASDLSDVLLTDMDTFMTLDFFVDDLDLINSPLVVLMALFKGMNECDDGADGLILGMFVF